MIGHKALIHCCVFLNTPSLFSAGKVSQDVSSRCQVMTMSAHTNPFLCLRTFLDKSISTSRYVERERTFDWFSLLDFTVKRYIGKHPSTGKILEKSPSVFWKSLVVCEMTPNNEEVHRITINQLIPVIKIFCRRIVYNV